jgi:hypothetical protein
MRYVSNFNLNAEDAGVHEGQKRQFSLKASELLDKIDLADLTAMLSSEAEELFIELRDLGAKVLAGNQ